MTRESREDDILDTMRWLNGLYHDIMHAAPDARVGILAFSQGVATATRWIANGVVRPQAFVAWAGGVAHDVARDTMYAALAQTAVTLVAGEQDEFLSPDARTALLTALQEWQPAARLVTYDGTHQLDRKVLEPLLAAL